MICDVFLFLFSTSLIWLLFHSVIQTVVLGTSEEFISVLEGVVHTDSSYSPDIQLNQNRFLLIFHFNLQAIH